MYYSQRSYPKTKLGTCSQTISQAGCFITSFCNLLKRMDIADVKPDKFNELAKKNGWYAQGCLFLPAKAAEHYGLTYEKVIKAPRDIAIAETDHYKKAGIPQHFFILKPDRTRLDPLDLNPDWEPNNYPVVSYRVFKKRPVARATTKTSSISISVPDRASSPILEPTEALPSKIAEVIVQEVPPTKTDYLKAVLEAIVNFLTRKK